MQWGGYERGKLLKPVVDGGLYFARRAPGGNDWTLAWKEFRPEFVLDSDQLAHQIGEFVARAEAAQKLSECGAMLPVLAVGSDEQAAWSVSELRSTQAGAPQTLETLIGYKRSLGDAELGAIIGKLAWAIDRVRQRGRGHGAIKASNVFLLDMAQLAGQDPILLSDPLPTDQAGPKTVEDDLTSVGSLIYEMVLQVRHNPGERHLPALDRWRDREGRRKPEQWRDLCERLLGLDPSRPVTLKELRQNFPFESAGVRGPRPEPVRPVAAPPIPPPPPPLPPPPLPPPPLPPPPPVLTLATVALERRTPLGHAVVRRVVLDLARQLMELHAGGRAHGSLRVSGVRVGPGEDLLRANLTLPELSAGLGATPGAIADDCRALGGVLHALLVHSEPTVGPDGPEAREAGYFAWGEAQRDGMAWRFVCEQLLGPEPFALAELEALIDGKRLAAPPKPDQRAAEQRAADRAAVEQREAEQRAVEQREVERVRKEKEREQAQSQAREQERQRREEAERAAKAQAERDRLAREAEARRKQELEKAQQQQAAQATALRQQQAAQAAQAALAAATAQAAAQQARPPEELRTEAPEVASAGPATGPATGPTTGPALIKPIAPAKKSGSGVLIGVGAAVVLAAGVGIYFGVFAGGEKKTPTPVVNKDPVRPSDPELPTDLDRPSEPVAPVPEVVTATQTQRDAAAGLVKTLGELVQFGMPDATETAARGLAAELAKPGPDATSLRTVEKLTAGSALADAAELPKALRDAQTAGVPAGLGETLKHVVTNRARQTLSAMGGPDDVADRAESLLELRGDAKAWAEALKKVQEGGAWDAEGFAESESVRAMRAGLAEDGRLTRGDLRSLIDELALPVYREDVPALTKTKTEAKLLADALRARRANLDALGEGVRSKLAPAERQAIDDTLGKLDAFDLPDGQRFARVVESTLRTLKDDAARLTGEIEIASTEGANQRAAQLRKAVGAARATFDPNGVLEIAASSLPRAPQMPTEMQLAALESRIQAVEQRWQSTQKVLDGIGEPVLRQRAEAALRSSQEWGRLVVGLNAAGPLGNPALDTPVQQLSAGLVGEASAFLADARAAETEMATPTSTAETPVKRSSGVSLPVGELLRALDGDKLLDGLTPAQRSDLLSALLPSRAAFGEREQARLAGQVRTRFIETLRRAATPAAFKVALEAGTPDFRANIETQDWAKKNLRLAELASAGDAAGVQRVLELPDTAALLGQPTIDQLRVELQPRVVQNAQPPSIAGAQGPTAEGQQVVYVLPLGVGAGAPASVTLRFAPVPGGSPGGGSMMTTHEISVGQFVGIATARPALIGGLATDTSNGRGVRTWARREWIRAAGGPAVRPSAAIGGLPDKGWFNVSNLAMQTKSALADTTWAGPSWDSPMTRIGSAGAARVANEASVRLPTLAEWQAAAGGNRAGHLRGQAYRRQWDVIAQRARDAPNSIEQLNVGSMSASGGVVARAAPGDDVVGSGSEGTPFPLPVGGAGGFEHLVGNVAEFVSQGGGVVVIGGSCLSPPTLAVDSPVQPTAAGGYTDVGFRLAFDMGSSAPDDPMSRVRPLLAGLKTEVVPADFK